MMSREVALEHAVEVSKLKDLLRECLSVMEVTAADDDDDGMFAYLLDSLKKRVTAALAK